MSCLPGSVTSVLASRLRRIRFQRARASRPSGSLLLVNSAQHSGPFDVIVSWGADSTARLGGFAYGAGSQPSPSPFSYYIPFEPGKFTVTITAPGGTAPLVQTTFTLAVGDRWTVVLTNSIEGELGLEATKQ